MKAVKIILYLFVAAFLSNFSVLQTFGQEKQSVQAQEKSATTEIQKPIGTPDGQNRSQNQTNERFRIGFQDSIEVNVFKHPELSLTVAINPDGTIALPRIDQPVAAACKTVGELKENITALYKKNYLRDPYINVRISNQQSQSFGVVGAVKKPGNFYLDRSVRLLELLSLAGGQDVEFAGGKIQVARIGSDSNCKQAGEPQDEKVVFYSYSLRDVLDGKQNPWLQPGDIISVLPVEEAYVVGNVFKPAKVPLSDPKTLTQAIAFAGGLNSTADMKKIVIQRQLAGSVVQTELVFDLKDIKDKKIPDPFLQANDIVNVGNDKGKSVQKGLLKIFTNGLPSIFTRVPVGF